MPDALAEILAQADQIGKNRMRLPAPPALNASWKEHVLNALNTVGMLPLGAKIAPGARVTGGVFDGSTPGTPSKIHAPNSAMDLSLHPAIKSDLGAPQVSGGGIAENNNIYNPKVNDILNYLSKRDLPVVGIKDPPGGTTYVTTQNPTRPEGKNEIRVRVPEPGNEHPPRGDATFKFQQRNGPGSFFDVNLKGMTGSAGRMLKENESGGKYNDLENLYAAIDKVTGRKLVEEGKGPILSKPTKPEEPTPAQADPNQLTLDLHSKIDEVLGKLDTSKLQGIDYQPGRKQTFGTEPTRSVGNAANDIIGHDKYGMEPMETLPNKWYDKLTTKPMTSETIGGLTNDPSNLVAANTGVKPKMFDPLLEAMNKTDSGKYQLAIYKQELAKKGIDTKGMSLMDIFKELNPHLFEDR